MDTKMQGELNDDFCDILQKRFEVYCSNEEIEQTPKEFAKFLLIHKLVRQRDANHFMVIHHYPHYLYGNDGRKTIAINQMEEVIPYGSRQMWAILEKPKKFRRCDSIPFNL